MGITADNIRYGYKKWSARAWVGGQPVTLVGGLPARTMSALYARSTCQMEVLDLPPSSGKAVMIDLVLEGVGSTRLFTGITADANADAADVRRVANVTDILDLDKTLPTAITWSGRSFVDGARDLLNAAGIANSQIDTIYDPGSGYMLGPVYAIKLVTTETIKSVFDELMEFGGTAAYVTPTGKVRIVDNTGVPASTSGTVYAESAMPNEFGVFNVSISIEGNEVATSVFTATGPKRPDGAQPDGTYTATGITGKPDSKAYRYAQSDTVCQAIAKRELSRRARRRRNIVVKAPLNPSVLPGDTILLRCARIGLSSSTAAYVLESKTTNDGAMDLVVSIGPSLVDGYSTSIVPPDVDFSMLVESQPITLAGVPVSGYLVQCHDESRDKAGYALSNRSWVASGTGADPTSSTDESPIFIFTDLVGASITLTVDSASGETASTTKEPQAPEVQTLSRVVSVASSADGWRVLVGTSGWRSFTPGADCTAVPSINDKGGALWAGFADGSIYVSRDQLTTAPTLSTTLDAGIGCIWVNETDYSHILAAHGPKLSRSTNGGTSWALVHTFADTITDCQSSGGSTAELRVTAGDSEWITFDGGKHWSAAVTASGTAKMIATAPWGHAVVYDDGHVWFEEGYTTDWAGVSPAPTALSSITPLLTEAGYIVGTCSDLIRDGALDALALSAGAGALYKLLWDGAQFVASAAAAAPAAGAGKVVNLLGAYPIDSSEAGVQIGYGPLAIPLDLELVLIPTGATGAADQLWHRRAGVWTAKALPQSGWLWRRIAIDQFNPDRWLLYGVNAATNPALSHSGGHLTAPGGQPALYYSADAGATWTSITISSLGKSVGADIEFVGFSRATGDNWVMGGDFYDDLGGSIFTAAIWRGSGATQSGGFGTATGNSNNMLCAAGVGDELIVTSHPVTQSVSYDWRVRAGASNFTQVGGSRSPRTPLRPAPFPGTSQAYAAAGGDGYLWATADYQTTQPTRRISADGGSAAVAATHGVYVGQRSGGILAVSDLLGAPTAAGVGPAGAAGLIAVDASGAYVAALQSAGVAFTSDGATWATISYPAGVTSSNIGNIAVITRT